MLRSVGHALRSYVGIAGPAAELARQFCTMSSCEDRRSSASAPDYTFFEPQEAPAFQHTPTSPSLLVLPENNKVREQGCCCCTCPTVDVTH